MLRYLQRCCNQYSEFSCRLDRPENISYVKHFSLQSSFLPYLFRFFPCPSILQPTSVTSSSLSASYSSLFSILFFALIFPFPYVVLGSVADSHHFDADPYPTVQFDSDPDPTILFSPDLDPPMLQNGPLRLPPFHSLADPDPAVHF
jgi:hypothetical protein